MRRSFVVLSLVAVIAAACGTGGEEGDTVSDPPDGATPAAGEDVPVATDREPIRERSVGCEEGLFYWDQSGCEPATMVELDRIISGGPPPDGIPPNDEPVYESIEHAAEWLEPNSPVMVVDVDDDVRAYPLCNSALVFERTIDGPEGEEVLDFGTSGRLYRSNLVMYDRQHRNLWTQFTGEGIVGERFLGDRLTRVPAWLFGFEELVDLHPDARVLSRDTGHNRDYGRNPYTGYDQEDSNPFLFDGDLDERHPPMARLVGLADDDAATAVLLDLLEEERAVEVELAPTDTDGRFVDERSGSTFDLRGRAIDGPLAGQQLEAVTHDDTFWFVWVAFRPDTEVVAS